MTARAAKQCSPLARAGAHGLSTKPTVERAGPPTRHAVKEITSPTLHHPHALPPARAITFVDVHTGKAFSYVLPGHVKANLTSGELTHNRRMLFDDDTLSADYRQALAVLAAGTIVETGTAKTVPTKLVQLLLQEIDRQNAVISAQSRRLYRLMEPQSAAVVDRCADPGTSAGQLTNGLAPTVEKPPATIAAL